MSQKIILKMVQYLPVELERGILYVSLEFSVAGHKCACGCGAKVITPLIPTEWKFTETRGLPSLYPSIGNWQLPCRSHYWIIDGIIEWSYDMSDEDNKKNWLKEEKIRTSYFSKSGEGKGIFSRLVNWFSKLRSKK